MNKKICEMVNEVVCDALVRGIVPWKEVEFINEPAVNAQGRPYSMLNQWILCKPGTWLTFNQIDKAGGRVNKGEKAKFVVFWTMWEKEKKDKDGNLILDKNGKPVIEKIPVLKYYKVFHESQCTGLNLKKLENVQVTIPECEEVVATYLSANPDLKIDESQLHLAFYDVNSDTISIPKLGKYVNREDYYAALFHEMIHSTGHPRRLARLSAKDAAAFNDEASKEELTAEIGSAVLLNKCGIDSYESQEASASYIQKWLNALKHDETMILTAAGRAEKAIAYILG